jgi:hypothetical protein
MQDLRETFRPIAERYRKKKRVVSLLSSALLAAALISKLLEWQSVYLAIWGALGLLLVVLLGVGLVGEKPACPNCNGSLFSYLGAYCPECGSRSVNKGGWPGSPRCEACGKDLGHGAKGRRRYKVRSCTDCGCLLDDTGL